MAKSTAHTTWNGSLMEGKGETSLATGAAGPLAMTWKGRTEDGQSTSSPEELIAAAHASCFSMALSNVLAKAGTPPEELRSSATVTFVPGTGITRSVLTVEGRVPGIDADRFQEAAADARDNCPVSQALRGNVELQVEARLVRS